MINLHKIILVGILLSGVSFASEVCKDLCHSAAAMDSGESSAKVFETCGCEAIFEEEKALQQQKEDNERLLADNLKNACEEQVCVLDVVLNDHLFISVDKANGRLNKDQVQKKAREIEAKQAKSPAKAVNPLPLMNDECKQLCGSCSIDENSMADTLAAEDFQFEIADSMCVKINESCKCTDYVVNAYELKQATIQDSVFRAETERQRNEQAVALAGKFLNKCDSKDTCIYTVSLHRNTLKVIDIFDAKKLPPQRPQTQQLQSRPQESVEQTKTNVPAEVQETETQEDSESEEGPVSNGVQLVFGQYEDDRFAGTKLSSGTSFELSAAYFLRWKLDEYCVLHLGLGLSLHFMEFDPAEEYRHGQRVNLYGEYSNISLEIPVRFKFGHQIGKYVAPYMDLSGIVRKPIFVSMTYEACTAQSACPTYEDSGLYDFADFEFDFYWGFGLEFLKHYGVEFQMIVLDFATGNGHRYKLGPSGDSWRILLEYMW